MSDADAANPHNVTTLRQTETLREHDHPEKAHADRQLQHQQGERWYVGEDVLGDDRGCAPARRSQHQRDDRCRVQLSVSHVECSWFAQQARRDW